LSPAADGAASAMEPVIAKMLEMAGISMTQEEAEQNHAMMSEISQKLESGEGIS
jgi:hypothetical protein